MTTQFPPLFDSKLLLPGSRVCVAISGGADSVSLLCSLHDACANKRSPLGVGLSAVHVNHGLRGAESDLDEAFVRALCERLNVPLQLRRVEVAAYREAVEATLEEAARSLRYEVFEEVLARDDVDDLLTAHTLDDQAETVMMRLLRGAWTEGLSGIYPEIRPKPGGSKRIVRPMLRTRRSEIMAYLQRIEQTWREDESNADPAHTRNRLRHEILPVLRRENPALDRTLANLADLAREEEEAWRSRLDQILPRLLLPGRPVRGGGRAVSTLGGTASVAVEIERLRNLDGATRRRVLRAAARSLETGHGGVRLSFDETARLLTLCGLQADATVPSRAGAVLRINRYVTAKRSARELTLSAIPLADREEPEREQ